ncbi:MAG TPA: hypothetical protein VFY17_08410 [Pilimelia sp.]|nr:hypothetical protein [Pilimelia sp.]
MSTRSRRPARWTAAVLTGIVGLAASLGGPPGCVGDAAEASAIDPVLRECAPGEDNTGRLTDVRLVRDPLHSTTHSLVADGWVRYCRPAPRHAAAADRVALVAHGVSEQRPQAIASPYTYGSHQQVRRFRDLHIAQPSDMHHGCLHAGRQALHCWAITSVGDGEPTVHQPSSALVSFGDLIWPRPNCGTCW